MAVSGIEHKTAAEQVQDTEALKVRIAELEELLRLVHVDVVRATGVLVHLDERIADLLKGKP